MTAHKRLLYNEDGETLDEIVFDGFMHLEQMDDDSYYLGVGEHGQFSIRADLWLTRDDEDQEIVRPRLTVTSYGEDHEFPLIQRHPTQAEVDAQRPSMAELITIRPIPSKEGDAA